MAIRPFFSPTAVTGAGAAVFFFLTISSLPPIAGAAPVLVGGRQPFDNFVPEVENFGPWADGLLKFTPVAWAPDAMAPVAKFPLVLAAKRTRRPDILDKFRLYRGGWDITNQHYWASVGFTGASGFILAALWFVSFGLALGAYHCCKWGKGMENKGTSSTQRICLILLLVFTCVAASGCILLSVGQDKFHDEVLNTLGFVVNQSDFTVQILRNVTDFLSLAKMTNIAQLYLPSDVQIGIDKLNIDLNNAARILTEKTNENSGKIRRVIYDVRCALIAVAALMLLLAILGFVLSFLGHKHAIYIFVMSGWLLVAVTFILCGVFVILNNAVADTCTAMDEWVRYPQAETALSNILPCVDERTTKRMLHKRKEVIQQLVNIVNEAILSIANSNAVPWDKNSYFYNQSGPWMPYLCSPYDSQLHNKPCEPQEVSFANASMVWQNYTCAVSESGSCISSGRVTPEMYRQLVAAVNVSYALDHYAPLLLSIRDCNFVRETFTFITIHYCPFLKHDLRVVSAGLALISTGVMLCLILWIFYAKRSQREEVFVKLSEVKVCCR